MKKEPEKQESKEIAVATSTAVAQQTPVTDFGASEDIGAQDILIERILLTQSMSKKVQADEVQKGKLVLQGTLEELGSHKGTEMEFIAIKAMRYWIETDKDTQEFIGRYPALSPEELLWEEKRGVRNIKRTYTHSFIVILPSKIANLEDVPLELAFRSTNLTCAKSINTKLINMKQKNLPSWVKVFKLKVDTKSNAKGTWYITVDSIARDATPEEIKTAELWAKNLSTANIKVSENDEDGDSSSLPPLNEEVNY